MDTAKCRRVMIWGGWLRLSHACIGLATLALLLTGWLLTDSPSLAEDAQDAHYLASSFLIFGLVVRVILMLVGKEHERLSSLFPASSELAAMAKTFRFYLSLGRSPMPGWYAQNPLWKPVYLAVYVALIMLVATGAVMSDTPIVLGFYLPSVHVLWAQAVLWFSVLHIASVFMHDYKNQTTDISAMVNGYRLFMLDSKEDGPGANDAIQMISLDSLKKRR